MIAMQKKNREDATHVIIMTGCVEYLRNNK